MFRPILLFKDLDFKKVVKKLQRFAQIFLKNKRIVVSWSRGLEQTIDRKVSLSLILSICQKADFR